MGSATSFHTGALFVVCFRLGKFELVAAVPTDYRVDVKLNDPKVHDWML